MKFTGNNVLVTGASRGIGAEIAKSLAAFGLKVWVNYRSGEAEAFLRESIQEDYDLDEHIAIINEALCDDNLSKMHILEQLNHIIYSDTITPNDYEEFERIKKALFSC